MEKKYQLPVEDVNDQNARIVELHFRSGDSVKKGQAIYEFETTKAAITVDAEDDGYIFYAFSEGDTVKVGDVVCLISQNKECDMTEIKKAREGKEEASSPFQLTKKAKVLVDQYGIDVSELSLNGIIREADILEHIPPQKQKIESEENILRLDKNNAFIQSLLSGDKFKSLSSEEKIKFYRDNGHMIGKNVLLETGAVLIGNRITIKNNVTIGKNTYIEVPDIHIENDVSIGSDCNVVAGKIHVGPFTKIANRVRIDISGGRNTDSRFVCGKGCLITEDVFINVCHEVRLGNEVALSPRSLIFTHSFWQSSLDGYQSSFGPVTIGNNSWLGAGSQIMPNVSVGEGSIIISASLVAKNVGDFTMVGGVPASVIREGIKRPLPKQKSNELIKKELKSVMKYLASDGYRVEEITECQFCVTRNDKEQKVCFVEDARTAPENIDTALMFDEKSDLLKKTQESFIINTSEIIGEVSPVGECILDHFRRQGIRFYKKEN